jgi:hypothetical protein
MRKGLRERETDGPPGEETEREKNAGPAWGFRLKEAFFARDSNKFNLNSNLKNSNSN